MQFFRSVLRSCLFTFLILTISPSASGQPDKASILFIYDASGSMWGKLGENTKKVLASKVLKETVAHLSSDQQMGLIVYGHRTKGDCQDVELVLDLKNADHDKVTTAIDAIQPLGKTPLAYSAQLAIEQVSSQGIPTTIILITDGIESCEGDLCSVIRHAQENGIDFKLHVVGFGIKKYESQTLQCAAKNGKGNYYSAQNAEELKEALTNVMEQKIDDPVPNHSFFAFKNGVPVDALVKIRKIDEDNYLKNIRTYGDTAKIYLKEGGYLIETFIMGGSDIGRQSLQFKKSSTGKNHHSISFDGGLVSLSITNNEIGADALITAFEHSSDKQVAKKRTYGKEVVMELSPGQYDIEVKCLDIEGANLIHVFPDVKIAPNETNRLIHNYTSGTLTFGVKNSSGELVDAVLKFTDLKYDKLVFSTRTYSTANTNPKRLTLQPGDYSIQIRTLGDHKGILTTEEVRIKAGEQLVSTHIIK